MRETGSDGGKSVGSSSGGLLVRTFIVADEPELRDALVSHVTRCGHDVCGTSDVEHATEALSRAGLPGSAVVVIDSGGDGVALRRLIDRVCMGTEGRVPAVLVLPAHSTWLKAGLPLDILPAAGVPAGAIGDGGLARAFAQLETGWPAGEPAGGDGAVFDRLSRELRGPAGLVRLTRSEGALFGALDDQRGYVVGVERLAQALWGRAVVDRHSRAAIRTHIHTLRGKLRAAGLADALQSLPGVGYRLARCEDALRDQASSGGGRSRPPNCSS